MADIPPPPPKEVDTEGRFARWSYQFWDYVAKNRPGFKNAQITATSPILLGTSGTSSFAISHATSGVIAGTYGAAGVTSQLVVNAQGHITNSTNVGTLGTFAGFNSLVLIGDAVGTSTTGTLTIAVGTIQGVLQVGTAVSTGAEVLNARGQVRLGRNNLITGGGQVNIERALDGSNAWAIDVFGTGTNPSLRILDLVGVGTGNVTLWEFLSPSGRWLGAPGGFGLGTGNTGLTFDGTGAFAAAGTGTFASIQAADLGTMARFNSYVLAGDVTGTSTTGTLTTVVGTIRSALQVGTAVATNATLLNVRGLLRLGRNDTSAEGGQINFERALEGSSTWILDVTGTSTSPTIRFINDNVSPTTVPFSISAADRWNGAPGGFGLGTGNTGFTYDGTGGVVVAGTLTAAVIAGAGGLFGTATGGFSRWGTSSASLLQGGTGTFASVRAADLGTMARFDSYVVTGAVTGTSTTGTLTAAAGVSTLAAAGYVTGTTTTGTLTTAYAGTSVVVGAVTGTSTTGTLTTALATQGATVLAGVVLGTSTTGTLTAAQNFTIGGATAVANVPVTPLANGTAVSCAAGTGTRALIPAYSLPANALSANRGVRFQAFGEFSTAAEISRGVAMVFGTLPLTTAFFNGGTGFWQADVTVLVSGANAQGYVCRFDTADPSNGITFVRTGTVGMDVTGAISLSAVKVGTTTSAATVTQRGLVVEMLN